eukprot:gnl/MRDRNA2_/MRDRNA2_57228_c0_seq1.p1 gnl/MRDRNA2_/MRDRNA2_57228_c0~~gnl/MRDRNA2_/MRDRNA2_57228_c0_seq1.p1  ORF type:complete len:624 (-),score=140.67 gnl/MRDRNA2_/MRDRNA2_57228_c0_seq1:222-2093(-)
MLGAHVYAEQHGVETLLEALAYELLSEQPQEPLTYLGSLLDCMARESAHLQGTNYSMLIQRVKAMFQAGRVHHGACGGTDPNAQLSTFLPGVTKGKGKMKGPPPPASKEDTATRKGKGNGKVGPMLPPPKSQGKGPPLCKAAANPQARTVKMTAIEALTFRALPSQQQDGSWEASTLGWSEIATESTLFTTIFVLQLWQMWIEHRRKHNPEMDVQDHAKSFSKSAIHGEAWLTDAQDWLAANQDSTSEMRDEVEGRARALAERMFPSWESRSYKVTQPTKEAMEAKQQEMKEKAQREQEEAAAQLRHWQTLTPCDIYDVPWQTVMKSMYVDGGSGGAILVEVEGGKAVCVKPKAMMAVAEYIAEYVANVLQVHVAKCRVVSAAEDEFLKICMALNSDTHHGSFNMHAQIYSTKNFLGILEFVPGFALMGAQAGSALKTSHRALFIGLGKLCSLDLILNNMDRMPLPIWSNHGNLSNVMIVGDSIIGIDQQVNPIEGVGLDQYVAKLRSLAMTVCRIESLTKTDGVDDLAAVSVRIEQALLENCGVKLEAESTVLVFQGMREGLQDVARLWKSGDFKKCLDNAEAAAVECFHACTTDVGLTRVSLMTEFLERIAREVSSAVEEL